MIGVLLHSREEGRRSSWAAVRKAKAISASFITDGDVMQVALGDENYAVIGSKLLTKDEPRLDLPEDALFVEVTHLAVAEDCIGVCVDLEI